MALSKVNPNFVGETAIGRRNLVINGDMRIAQRGATTTGIGQSANYFSLDRVKLFNSGGAGATYTVSQETDAPTGFTKSYKIQTTTADTSLPAASYTILRLATTEAQDLLRLGWGTSSAKSLTFSFWVKSNKTGDQTILAVTHASMQQHVKQIQTVATSCEQTEQLTIVMTIIMTVVTIVTATVMTIVMTIVVTIVMTIIIDDLMIHMYIYIYIHFLSY